MLHKKRDDTSFYIKIKGGASKNTYIHIIKENLNNFTTDTLHSTIPSTKSYTNINWTNKQVLKHSMVVIGLTLYIYVSS